MSERKTDISQFTLLEYPKTTWTCRIFGNNAISFNFTQDISWWQRFWTWFFFGSIWEKVK